jgi:hypothetical protein
MAVHVDLHNFYGLPEPERLHFSQLAGCCKAGKKCPNFEEEQSRTKPALHGIYCAAVESV